MTPGINMARRPRPKPVRLTESAASRVRKIMAERGFGNLRFGVRNGGCAGKEYVLDYSESPSTLNEILDDNGVTISIDTKAVWQVAHARQRRSEKRRRHWC